MYRRYVNNIFFLFPSTENLKIILTSNTKTFPLHLKRNAFTSEKERNASLSFLDIKITRYSNTFVTSVYRKPKFSEFFTNFESFISKYCERSLSDTLLYRGFSLCSNVEKFLQEVNFLNSVFKSKGYP